MSLSKHKELEDLKAENFKVATELNATYKKLANEALEQTKSDFISFFKEHEFTVKTSPKPEHSFGPKHLTVIEASYQNLKVTFENNADPEANQARLIQLHSTIGGKAEYHVRISVSNPKEKEFSSRSYLVPNDEAKRLEKELEIQRESLKENQEAKEGLGETTINFLLVGDAVKRGQKQSSISFNSFKEVLQHLFDK